MEDLRQLVDKIHLNNMSLILDLPISHPSYRIDQPSEWGRNHPNDTGMLHVIIEVFGLLY